MHFIGNTEYISTHYIYIIPTQPNSSRYGWMDGFALWSIAYIGPAIDGWVLTLARGFLQPIYALLLYCFMLNDSFTKLGPNLWTGKSKQADVKPNIIWF